MTLIELVAFIVALAIPWVFTAFIVWMEIRPDRPLRPRAAKSSAVGEEPEATSKESSDLGGGS